MAEDGLAAVMPDDKHRRRWLNRYSAAVSRCTNSRNSGYHNYGGRGIKVCDAWQDQRVFLRDIQLLPGWDDPALEMDRQDNNGDYAPGNIRLVGHSRQMRNTRITRTIEHLGETMSVSDFRERFCPRYINDHTIIRKIKEGLPSWRIISDQENCRGRYRKYI